MPCVVMYSCLKPSTMPGWHVSPCIFLTCCMVVCTSKMLTAQSPPFQTAEWVRQILLANTGDAHECHKEQVHIRIVTTTKVICMLTQSNSVRYLLIMSMPLRVNLCIVRHVYGRLSYDHKIAHSLTHMSSHNARRMCQLSKEGRACL